MEAPVSDAQTDGNGGRSSPSATVTRRREELSRLCTESGEDLVAWRGGDRAALERLVHRLTPMLWHTVRAYRLDDATAEDVVQSTWLAFVKSSDTVADPQALVRWLTVTARRQAWQTARVTGRADLQDDEILDLQADPGPSVEDVVERAHRDGALWDAVRTLPERCQRLLRVIAFADRPDYESLALDLGMPIGSIGPTRGRCLDKLRAILGAPSEWRTA